MILVEIQFDLLLMHQTTTQITIFTTIVCDIPGAKSGDMSITQFILSRKTLKTEFSKHSNIDTIWNYEEIYNMWKQMPVKRNLFFQKFVAEDIQKE